MAVTVAVAVDVDEGVEAKLNIVSPSPTEQRQRARMRRGLKRPDREAGLFFMMISCVTFEYSKNSACPVAFFPKLAAPRKEFPRRSESILTGKPALLRSDFPCSSVAAGVTPAILCACAFRVLAMPTACSYSLQKRNWRQRFDSRPRALDKCVQYVCRRSRR